jgi:hypothetical protein
MPNREKCMYLKAVTNANLNSLYFFYYRQRFYEKHFKKRVNVFWLPDSFGKIKRPFFSILDFPVAYLYLFIFSTLALLAHVYRILWPGKSPTHFMAQSMAFGVHQY